MITSLASFQSEVARLLGALAGKIDVTYYSRNYQGEVLTFDRLPPVTFDVPKGDATPLIEFKDGKFHFVPSERGVESERITGNAEEILYFLFKGITSQLATNFELRHRIAGQDPRIMIFAKQLELLTFLDPAWSALALPDQQKVRRRHPFTHS